MPVPVSPVQLNPETPGKLGEIIDKALEKDRDLRYQGAPDLRTDLIRLKCGWASGQALRGVPGSSPITSPLLLPKHI